MPRFFISSSDIADGERGRTVRLTGEDARHAAKVLRIRTGEHVTVCDENGTEYDTEAENTGDGIELTIVPGSDRRSVSEAPYEAVVYQALAKGDRFDTAVQKSTELGASAVVPVVTSRCDVVPGSGTEQKTARWQRIAYEASKQSGRARIPEVMPVMTLKDAAERARATSQLILVCQPGGCSIGEVLKGTDAVPERISVFVGPEGGFTEKEAELAERNGAVRVSLGPRILRTETAAPFVLSCLSYEFEHR